jgi:hypothetical protein
MLAQRVDSADDAPQAASATAERRVIFISHATPEDNAFATWLATQLAIAGYAVWCDTTKLLGGEAFWKDITEAIEQHAFRFLFASTLDSNRKAGTLRELRIAADARNAKKLENFVVPLKIDKFPFASTQKEIRDLNFVRFDDNWAAGLKKLLALLEREKAPKSSAAGPGCVNEWYRRSLDSRRQAVVSNEECLTNWFRIGLPRKLHFHRYRGSAASLEAAVLHLRRPHRVRGSHIATFATLTEVNAQMPEGVTFDTGVATTTDTVIRKGEEALNLAAFDASNIVSDLIRQAWEGTMTKRGLCYHPLASGLTAWFFKNEQLPQNRAHFQSGSRRAFRQLVGHKSKRSAEGVRTPDGYWHYAISASPQILPFPRLVLRHHVVFTDDGVAPWRSSERMHKARRGVCKNWWNREWRDRLLAFSAVMGGKRGNLMLAVSDRVAIRVSMAPMMFTSPLTYLEDNAVGMDESTEVELIEEQEEESDNDSDVANA